MVDVLGELFPFAVGVALSPLPLIAVLFVLRSPSGRLAGAAFLFGRLVAVAVVAMIAAFLAEFLPESGGTSPLGAGLRIVLGAALMVGAIATWIKRSKNSKESELPKWMASMEDSSTFGAGLLAIVISLANIKELAFGIGAGLMIAGADLGLGATVAAVAIYTGVACMAIILIVGAYWFAADQLRLPLDAVRNWLVRNKSVIAGAVLLIIGANLVGEGIVALP